MPRSLPTSARLRVDAADPTGRVDAIQVRPARRASVLGVSEWDLTSDVDHGRSPKRAVTLIQAEHLPAIGAMLGRPVDFVLELTVRCHPCRRMDEAFGVGGFAAMFGHGGWCARIVRAGIIRVGDEVRLADVPQQRLFQEG